MIRSLKNAFCSPYFGNFSTHDYCRSLQEKLQGIENGVVLNVKGHVNQLLQASTNSVHTIILTKLVSKWHKDTMLILKRLYYSQRAGSDERRTTLPNVPRLASIYIETVTNTLIYILAVRMSLP